jgi:hypothetical protein
MRLLIDRLRADETTLPEALREAQIALLAEPEETWALVRHRRRRRCLP